MTRSQIMDNRQGVGSPLGSLPDMTLTGFIDTLDQLRSHFRNSNKVREYVGHRSKVHSLSWNCTGSKLATGSTDNSIRLWPVEKLYQGTGTVSSIELKGHTAGVEQVAWSPKDADILASVSADRTVRLWDTKSPNAIHTWSLSVEVINIAWHPSGRILAVGTRSDHLIVFSTETKEKMAERAFSMEINEMIWSPQGDFLTLTTGLGTLEVVAFPSLESTSSLTGHTSNCYCIDLEPSHRRLFAVGGADAVVSIWDATEMACIRTICRLDWPIRALNFSHDGRLLASASEGNFIDISFVASGESVCRVPVTAPVNCVAWNPQKYILAFAGEDVDGRTGRSNGVIKLFGLQ